MKTQKLKRMMSLFLAALICVTTLVGFGTTAYAAEETDEVCLVSFPRDGDANYGGEWGHGSFNFMNGWFAQTSRYTTVRAMGSYDGNICYCIEPGVPQESGDRYTKKGENFWDNYPSSYNHTISPDDIKLFIGRIFQYGYTGTISTSWRSQNEGGDKLAHAVATQLLVWETIVGERDADFNKVGTGGKDAICDQVSTGHPLYNIKHVYDISQTTSRMRAQPPVSHDARALLGALIYKKPVPIQSVDELPDGLGALYDHEQEAIFVCRGMEANDLFCEVSKALAQAELAQTGEEYDPQTASFKAHCVSYILGKEFGVDVSDYSFENPADFLRTDDPQEIRTELSEIRDTAYDISARMARSLEKNKAPRQNEQER